MCNFDATTTKFKKKNVEYLLKSLHFPLNPFLGLFHNGHQFKFKVCSVQGPK